MTSDTGDRVRTAPPKAPPKKRAQKKRPEVPDPLEAIRGSATALEAQEEERKRSESAALSFLEKHQANTAKNKAKSLAGVMWYVKCRYCEGPAIWIHNKLSGWLQPEDWSASYKARGVLWPTTKIPCQCCIATGRGNKMISMDLDRSYANGTPRRRTVHKMMVTEYEALVTGGSED